MRHALRVALLAGLALALSGCASVTIPLLSSRDAAPEPEPLTTASTAAPAGIAQPAALPPPIETPLPAPTAFTAVEAARETATAAPSRPTAELVAALEARQDVAIRFTDSDLQVLGAALTRALREDADVGTFSWSHEATGKRGVMTPFRSNRADGRTCRMVSVEVTAEARDAIVLADACEEPSGWVFTSPRAGEAL